MFQFNEQNDLQLLKQFYANWPMYNDPPFHNPLREFAKVFLNEALKRLDKERLSALVQNRIYFARNRRQSFNIVADFSNPISDHVFADIFDSGNEAIRKCIKKSRRIVAFLGKQRRTLSDAHHVQSELKEILNTQLIEEATDYAQRNFSTSLDETRVKFILLNVLLDGHKSLSAGLSNNVFVLLKRQDYDLKARYLRRALIEAEPVFQYVSRIATNDFQFKNYFIKKGDKLILSIASANSRFDHKHNDSSKLHLSFGYGIHSCIGARLFQVVQSLVLEHINDHIERMSIINYRWERSIGYRFLTYLNIRYQAAL